MDHTAYTQQYIIPMQYILAVLSGTFAYKLFVILNTYEEWWQRCKIIIHVNEGWIIAFHWRIFSLYIWTFTLCYLPPKLRLILMTGTQHSAEYSIYKYSRDVCNRHIKLWCTYIALGWIKMNFFKWARAFNEKTSFIRILLILSCHKK